MWLADIRVKWYAHSAALNNLKLKQHRIILHRR